MLVNRGTTCDLRCRHGRLARGRPMPILVEYVLLPGVNNAPGHAREVADFLAGLSVT